MLPSRCDARYTPSRFYFIFITYNSGKDDTIGFEGEQICMIRYPRAHITSKLQALEMKKNTYYRSKQAREFYRGAL